MCMSCKNELLNHVDLFSGIGGFALAARANGIKTVQFVEIDQRCRDFLSKTWPGVAIHDDIRTFDGSRWTGAFLLTGGVPCQPSSRAGKRRGKKDHRWLWPEAIKVLGVVRPAWAIFENPPGIGDVGLAGILSDVENENYQVRVFSIPACAVGSPQRRERYWIVANRKTAGHERHSRRGMDDDSQRREITDGSNTAFTQGDLAHTGSATRRTSEGAEQQTTNGPSGDPEIIMADPFGKRCGKRGTPDGKHERTQFASNSEKLLGDTQGVDSRPRPCGCESTKRRRNEFTDANIWDRYIWLPCADGKVRRSPDDSFGLVDGLHRSLLGALGNSIVWQVAEEIVAAIVKSSQLNGFILQG